MKKKFYFIVGLFCFALFAYIFSGSNSIKVLAAEEELIYDTSNHYLGACGMTDTTTWTLDKDLEVSNFQIWYYWASGEGPVSFDLKKDGADFSTGLLTRTSCDPYQTSWCNGDLAINKTFLKGSYSLKVANRKQCAIPDGNGTVRLYGIKASTDLVPESTLTAQLRTPDDTKTDSTLKLIFDSSNNYLGACAYTKTSTWTGVSDMNVVLLQIWYKWETSESKIPFTLTKDGVLYAQGSFTRADCDPYQTSWCNGNFTINKTFPKGSTYVIAVDKAFICRDNKGMGVVRLYGLDDANASQASSATDQENSKDLTMGKEKDSNKTQQLNPLYLLIPVIVIGAGAAGAIWFKKRRMNKIIK